MALIYIYFSFLLVYWVPFFEFWWGFLSDCCRTVIFRFSYLNLRPICANMSLFEFLVQILIRQTPICHFFKFGLGFWFQGYTNFIFWVFGRDVGPGVPDVILLAPVLRNFLSNHTVEFLNTNPKLYFFLLIRINQIWFHKKQNPIPNNKKIIASWSYTDPWKKKPDDMTKPDRNSPHNISFAKA